MLKVYKSFGLPKTLSSVGTGWRAEASRITELQPSRDP